MSFPYKNLLPALADVIDTSQKQDDVASKQDLLAATNKFRDLLVTLKRTALNLPGGDMSLVDQDQVIKVLEQLRDYKRWDNYKK
ncbi:hypothetical protein Clacol_003775 [Clathrus columnatus]|uniref:Mediator of RNA polymerase II transcription subunit 9 n=1 Tax=Clathrus columnatus TaxID=1419009 RepID=A0AAV5A7R4_9AGAM|nr:hypothetical protein Clacol_003775 [Clathrus columnatus]